MVKELVMEGKTYTCIWRKNGEEYSYSLNNGKSLLVNCGDDDEFEDFINDEIVDKYNDASPVISFIPPIVLSGYYLIHGDRFELKFNAEYINGKICKKCESLIGSRSGIRLSLTKIGRSDLFSFYLSRRFSINIFSERLAKEILSNSIDAEFVPVFSKSAINFGEIRPGMLAQMVLPVGSNTEGLYRCNCCSYRALSADHPSYKLGICEYIKKSDLRNGKTVFVSWNGDCYTPVVSHSEMMRIKSAGKWKGLFFHPIGIVDDSCVDPEWAQVLPKLTPE
jgi:hypothetical protein